MQIIAHRGYKHVTPENTLAAFESAVKAGADMIETDIHVCKSGDIVIMHDADVSATSNGAGKIADLTLTELKQLDVGGWFGDAYQGQRIITLPELMDFYQKHRDLKLLLEFKGEWSVVDCQHAIEILNNATLRDRAVLESFDTTTMANLRTVPPDYQRGLLIDFDLDKIPSNDELLAQCRELDVMCLNPSVKVTRARPDLVRACHDAGLQVMVWTADAPTDFALLTELGVEAICTNRPEFLAGWLAGQKTVM